MDTNFVSSGIVDISLRNGKKSYNFLQDKHAAKILMENLREADSKYSINSELTGIGSGGWNITLKITHYDLIRFLRIYYPEYQQNLEKPRNGIWEIEFWEYDLRNVSPNDPRLIKLQIMDCK